MAEEDIIFGKNRHFFGGIEPNNVPRFYVDLTSDMSHYIRVYFPKDTVIDDQVVCSVGGVVVRRATDRYPVDEFDGEFVGDFTIDDWAVPILTIDQDYFWASCYMDIEPDTDYYYSAFPYSRQGVYNRNIANRTTLSTYKIDINDMYVCDTGDDSYAVYVYYTHNDPDNVNPKFCLCGSKTRYPINPLDSDEIIYSNNSSKVIDFGEVTYKAGVECNLIVFYLGNDLKAETIYYSLFVHDGDMSGYVPPVVGPSKCKYPDDNFTGLLGFDIDLDDSYPSTRVTYPSDVDNYKCTPVTASSDGDWRDLITNWIFPKPCVLYPSGVVKGYLKENDYTKYLDGTDATDDITDANNLGLNVMMEWPKIYTKRWEVNGVYSFRCSNVKVDDTYECWCNINDNGEEIDHFYTGVYLSSDTRDENIRQSISGASQTSETTTSAFTTKCQANGAGWGPEEAIDRMLINDLLTMVYKTTDIPLAILGGIAPGYNSTAGANNNNGMFYGSNAGIKVFGMENWWTSWGGNINSYARYISGLYCNKGHISIKLPGNSEYTDVGEISGTSGGYINGTKTTNFGRFPISTGGSSSTYESDALVYSTSYTYSAYATGGVDSYLNGPFALSFMNSTGVSGSLSFKPIDRVE